MLKDTLTLTSRTLKHVTRSMDTILTTVMMPIAFMLLFVFVFGGAIKNSLPQGTYINYILPGILVMTAVMGTSYVGFRLFEDKQRGFFARVKSMPIKAGSFLWGHVITSVFSGLISIALVIGIAFLMGFRSQANLGQWLMALGLIFLLVLAMTWLMAIPGIIAKSVAGATAITYPFTFLPMLSSAFVPTDTMPGPVRWFAENQPLTGMTDAIRHLFAGQSAGNSLWNGIIWMGIILVVSYIAATAAYKKAV